MARKKYAQSCDTSIPRGGMYRSVLKIRHIDAENAILKAKQLSWTDNENIFLVGLSEGGITTATYSPKNIESSIKGRVIEGWTCNAGWEEYQGVNTPYNEPVLSLVAKYDPWFQAEYLKGHCGQFKNNNPLSKSIIIDDGTQLSKGHGLMHDKKIKKIIENILNILHKSIKDIKDYVKDNLKILLNDYLRKIDVVTREEFDVQKEVLLKTRKKLDDLEEKFKK